MKDINKWQARFHEIETREAHIVVKTEKESGEEVPYVAFRVLEEIPWLSSGFSTRLGGVSQGIFETMNLGFGRGDEEADVEENLRRMLSILEIGEDKIAFSEQVHKTEVQTVTAKDCTGLHGKLKETDGMVTGEAGIALATSFADCVPVLLVDKEKKVIANVHSGWRGTVGKISAAAVEKMRREYGCEPEDIAAVIGPSICQDCYEIGEDVARQFLSFLREPSIREAAGSYREEEKGFPAVLKKKKDTDGKYLLDLWLANALVLLSAGIPYRNIHVSGICTCCHPDIFFSHRASNGQRGNLNAFLKIKES